VRVLGFAAVHCACMASEHASVVLIVRAGWASRDGSLQAEIRGCAKASSAGRWLTCLTGSFCFRSWHVCVCVCVLSVQSRHCAVVLFLDDSLHTQGTCLLANVWEGAGVLAAVAPAAVVAWAVGGGAIAWRWCQCFAPQQHICVVAIVLIPFWLFRLHLLGGSASGVLWDSCSNTC
jgi:hypothetical protein